MAPLIDALASPSRLAIVRALGEAPGSSASELSARAGLHVNTVRTHLHELEAGGVLERESGPPGRGRPTLRYRLRDRAQPAGEELLGLASLLGDALHGARPTAEQIRRAGAEWGRRWPRLRPGEEPCRDAQASLERLGFAVGLEGSTLRLSACPCPLVAREDPAIVCRLADAVTEGVLEGTPMRVERTEHDPARRRCAATLAPAER